MRLAIEEKNNWATCDYARDFSLVLRFLQFRKRIGWQQEMQLEILQMRSGDARDSSVEIDQCNQEENGQVTWDDTGKRFFSFRHYYNHEENW